MSKFKIGDIVRDISGYSRTVGYDTPAVGKIVEPYKGDTWTVEWNHAECGKVCWNDSQLELVTPQPLPVRSVTRLVIEFVSDSDSIYIREFGDLSVAAYRDIANALLDHALAKERDK